MPAAGSGCCGRDVDVEVGARARMGVRLVRPRTKVGTHRLLALSARRQCLHHHLQGLRNAIITIDARLAAQP